MIFLLIGQDVFTKEHDINAFLDRELGERKDDPLARQILYATDTNIASLSQAIIDSCSSISLFAETQTIVVKKAETMKEADIKIITEWLKKDNPDCSLVFDFAKLLKTSALYKALKSCKAEIREYPVPKPWELETWITNICISYFNKRIEPTACRYLADALGTDTANIISELEKVLQFAPDLTVFTEKLVKDFIVPQREISAFEIKDSFGDYNAKAYTKKLHDLLNVQKTEAVLIVGVLFDYAVQLLHICRLLDQGKSPEEIAAELGVNAFIFCKKSNEPKRARTWGAPRLTRVISRLAELDYDFKNGRCATRNAQELALASLVIPVR